VISRCCKYAWNDSGDCGGVGTLGKSSCWGVDGDEYSYQDKNGVELEGESSGNWSLLIRNELN
jgi:hypothetical protein